MIRCVSIFDIPICHLSLLILMPLVFFTKDWTAKTRPSVVASTTVVPNYRIDRSSSAEVLHNTPSRHPSAFDFAVPQYPRSTDTSTRSNLSTFYLAPPSTDSRAFSANSSPSAANFPHTPQQQISPSQSSLSIDSVPTSMLDDPAYAYRYGGYAAMPGGLLPSYSPGSNTSADVSAPLNIERRHIPSAPPSVLSAPPSRTSFPPLPHQQSWSPLVNGQKEVALRRFRSATPTIGGAQVHSPRPKSSPETGAQLPLRRTSSPSHLGLYISSQADEPLPGTLYSSPGNALSHSSLPGSEATKQTSGSPVPHLGASFAKEAPRGNSSSASPIPRAVAQQSLDAYSMSAYTGGSISQPSSEILLGTLSDARFPEMAPAPNSNLVNSSPSVQATNMAGSYRNASMSYAYASTYTPYSSYAV